MYIYIHERIRTSFPGKCQLQLHVSPRCSRVTDNGQVSKAPRCARYEVGHRAHVHTYIHTYISARVHTALDPADLPREEGEEGAKGVEREAKDARGLHNLSGTSVGSLLCTLS